jgi:hypothetical protein
MNSSLLALKLTLLLVCFSSSAFAQKLDLTDLSGSYNGSQEGRPEVKGMFAITKAGAGYTMESTQQFSSKTFKYALTAVPSKDLEDVSQAWFGKSTSAVGLSCFIEEDIALCKIDPKTTFLENIHGKNTGLFVVGIAGMNKISQLLWLTRKN